MLQLYRVVQYTGVSRLASYGLRLTMEHVTASVASRCCCCIPVTGALSSSSTPDLSSATEGAKDAAESAKDAASDLKSKAKSALKGSSALPNSMATVADLNADVRGDALNYRDPAIATPQDKVTGVCWGGGCAGGTSAVLSMSAQHVSTADAGDPCSVWWLCGLLLQTCQLL
jgi:hypothetical protein